MSFFCMEISPKNPFVLELEQGDTFHLTQAIISQESKGKGKIYVMATCAAIIDDEEEEGEGEAQEEEIVKTPVCLLQTDKCEQYALNLMFDCNYKITFSVEGDEKSVVNILGYVVMNPEGGHSHMGDCEDEDCQGCVDSDEEFEDGFSDDEDMDFEDEEEDDVPTLKSNGKIKEIPDEPEKPAVAAAAAPANKKKQAAAPVKKEPAQPKKEPAQPKKEQPKKQAAAAPQQNGKRPAEANQAKPQQQKKSKK